MQKKNTYKLKYVYNKSKEKGTLLYNQKQTLEFPKVSINHAWKGGLHKRQVKYLGMVKLTNKRRRKQRLISFYIHIKITIRG